MYYKENILFIGNGFDLHNNMKTSYTDYLKSLNIPNTYISSIDYLIEIYKGFNILSSVEIELIYDDATHHERKLLNEIAILNQRTENKISINKNPAYIKTPKTSQQITAIMLQYDDFQHINNNRKKIYFNDFNNQNKFNILSLFSNYLTNMHKQNNSEQIISLQGHLFNKAFSREEDFDFELIDKANYEDALNNVLNFSKGYTYFALYLELIRTYPTFIANNPICNISELSAGEDWMDLENILYHNQFTYFQSTLSKKNNNFETSNDSLFMYRNFIKLFDTDVDIYADFELFKSNFSQYIALQQTYINKAYIKYLLESIYNKYHFTKVYNFNYSNYINNIFQNINSLEKNANYADVLVDNIHGSVDDGKNIVFGSNHYLFLNNLTHYNDTLKSYKKEEYIQQKELHYKLTKFYQVLKLSPTKNTMEIKPVESLTVLGHSIGKQDYEYFHTIINTNPQKIKLNIVWSTFKNKNGETINNLESLTEAVYEMLESYKDLYKDITIHRMILEHRIKFIPLDDFIESAE